jgi:hypothetical protein
MRVVAILVPKDQETAVTLGDAQLVPVDTGKRFES